MLSIPHHLAPVTNIGCRTCHTVNREEKEAKLGFSTVISPQLSETADNYCVAERVAKRSPKRNGARFSRVNKFLNI